VDYVADKRASTPTGAAELATIDQREIYQHLDYALGDMEQSLKERLNTMNEDLKSLKGDLNISMLNLIKQQQQLLQHKEATLEALNPKNIISRGYSLTVDEEGHPLTVSHAKKGQIIKTILKDGTITSEIIDTEE
jgi:exodeoxyribonuclease VII large subunit